MKKNYTVALLFALLFGWSCTNLDETVYSDLPSNEFFEDENLLAQYSGKAYQSLQTYCGEQSLWTLTLQASDECAVPVSPDGAWAEPRYGEIHKHNFVTSNKFIRTGWDFCFNGIASCNDVLHVLETYAAPSPARDKTVAEVKTLRAFYYFLAIDGWGNIPFSTDVTDRSYPPQKDRAFMFQFILDEINNNMELLDEAPSAANYGRITKGMANTLLAKMYLNAKEWIGTEKWAEAEQACQRIISTGVYDIESEYKNNFKVNNQGSKENIFVIPYSSIYTADSHAFIIYIMTFDSRNAEKFNIPAGCWDGFVCQPSFFELYNEADTRRSDTWLYGQQTNYAGVPVDGFVIEPVFDESKYTEGRSTNDGARLWKWTYQDDGLLTGYGNVSMDNHFALFRYADVLYMYTEALLRQGKSLSALTARPDFQRIRTRAGLSSFTESDITEDNLLKERGVELAWEGWRRQDLIRFGKWNNAWWGKPASEMYKKLYPIPLERLNANPNLDQNSGY
jgi:hypothetical protein